MCFIPPLISELIDPTRLSGKVIMYAIQIRLLQLAFALPLLMSVTP